MVGHVILLGILLTLQQPPPRGAAQPAADKVILRDRSIVLGLLAPAAPASRGSLELVARRDWARKNLPRRMPAWERASANAARTALAQRQHRLKAWRTDRAANAAADDRIVKWIDRELARGADPGAATQSTLLPIKLSASEVGAVERRPAPADRLMRLAWLCNLPDPESMPLDELKDALEARGYAADAGGRNPPPALDRLLPPVPEPEMLWLGRRAATELAVDSDLRFIRFNDMVVPDTGAGQPLGGMGLNTAFSQLKKLLDPDGAPQNDPLVEKLKAIEAKGRKGAVLTRLEIQPDLDGVTVEATLWVCTGPLRWVPFGSRSATVRPGDIQDDAGKRLADDPQVQGAFSVVESLGLGAVPADLKQRALKIGAATDKALGTARSAFNQDLDALVLPVLEPEGGDSPQPKPQK
jgi:hypothetical protein